VIELLQAPFLRSIALLTSGRRLLLGVSFALLVISATRTARADLTIKDDGAVPSFIVELEPHGVFTPFWPPRGSADVGLGFGALIGINVAPRGFIPDLADSVSIGLGVDWVRYFGSRASASECAEWQGSGNQRICVRTRAAGGAGAYVFAPAVMQWNFYLTDSWSVFGEPGIGMYFFRGAFDDGLRVGLTPVINTGGRFHFSERATLTLRIGYPYTTVGISIYL
jgi:hypothetical protein